MIRQYKQSDMPEMIRIWNEVVEEGIAFPQEECLDLESGAAFLNHKAIRESPRWMERSLGCTSFIPTMSEDVDISAMPAMRFHLTSVVSTSARSW